MCEVVYCGEHWRRFLRTTDSIFIEEDAASHNSVILYTTTRQSYPKNKVIFEVNMARISYLNATCFSVEAEILLATVFQNASILKTLALSKSNGMIPGTHFVQN